MGGCILYGPCFVGVKPEDMATGGHTWGGTTWAAFLDALVSCAGQPLRTFLLRHRRYRRLRDWAAATTAIAATVAKGCLSPPTHTHGAAMTRRGHFPQNDFLYRNGKSLDPDSFLDFPERRGLFFFS